MSYNELEEYEVADNHIAIEDSSKNNVNENIELSVESSRLSVNNPEPPTGFAVKEYIPKEEKVKPMKLVGKKTTKKSNEEPTKKLF